MCVCLLLRSREEGRGPFEDQCGGEIQLGQRKGREFEAVVFNVHLRLHTDTNKQTNRIGALTWAHTQ